MKSVVIRHLNDIVSLTVLALMAMALVAGQVDAAAHPIASAQPNSTPRWESTQPAPILSFAVDVQDSIPGLQVVLEVRSQ